MARPKYKVGQAVRIWKPGHAEHGSTGTIATVRPYTGPRFLDRWEYRCDDDGWLWPWAKRGGPCAAFMASVGERMLVSEENWKG